MLKIILTVAALTCALGSDHRQRRNRQFSPITSGMRPGGPKQAVILGKAGETVTSCALKSAPGGEALVSVPVQAVGPVKKWRDWYFWTAEFGNSGTRGELSRNPETGEIDRDKNAMFYDQIGLERFRTQCLIRPAEGRRISCKWPAP